jgi:peptide/nickel transport system permease protein
VSSAVAPVPRPPAAAWAGVAVPGLGHVLTGRKWVGATHLVVLAVLVLSAITGAPRLQRLLFPPPSQGGFGLHAWIAVATWLLTAFLLWRAAWRLATADRRPKPPASAWRLTWRQFTRSHVGLLGLAGVEILALLTLLTPLLAPHDPNQIDVGPHSAPPSAQFLFGTDDFGRDLLSRLLYGARISLSIGFLAVGISATFGALWGAVSGFLGGKIDTVMSWLVDLLLSLPRLVLVITMVGLFRPSGTKGLYMVIAILGFTGWMGVSRIVRGMVLSLKEQEFIQASRAIGQRTSKIITQHLLPNALAPVIVHATLGIGATILAEAALSFLGLGVPPPISTWGSIVNDGREFLRSAWWIATIPGFLIVFAVMSFNMLGDGLRDALDPKLRNRG